MSGPSPSCPPRAELLMAVLALLLTPLAHALSFAPIRMWWLAWIAFVPWFAALRAMRRTRSALMLSAATTLLGAYFVADWLPAAVANYYQQGLLLGLALFFAVWAVTIAPYVLLFTLVYRSAARSLTLWLPIAAGMAWAACELLRVRSIFGDPFGLLGYSQLDLRLLQIADVTGIYGPSALVAAANVAVAEIVLALLWQRRRSAAAIGALAPLLLLIGAAWFYGAQRERNAEGNGPAAVSVAIVQADLDLGSQWRQEFYGENLEAYLRLSLQALRHDKPRVVIWPESAMTFFVAEERVYRASIGSLFEPFDAELIAGGPRSQPGEDGARFFNSAFLIAPDGSIAAHYDKQELLPFAEYFPFGGVQLLRRQFAGVREFTPGGAARMLPSRAGLAGVLICNEAMFGELAGARTAAGAEILLNLANDSWLGEEKYAEQAFDMARVRAVEQRRYLLRASTSGPSAVIAANGAVVAKTAYATATTLAAEVHRLDSQTFYGSWGDVFGLLCCAVTLAIGLRGGKS